VQRQGPGLDVDLDEVPILDESDWTADRGLRGDLQDDGAEGGPAHPSVGDPQHVVDVLVEQLLGDLDVAKLRRARITPRPDVLQDEHRVACDVKLRSVDPRVHILDRGEDDGRAPVAHEV